MSNRVPKNREVFTEQQERTHPSYFTTEYDRFVPHAQNRQLRRSMLRKARHMLTRNKLGWDPSMPMVVVIGPDKTFIMIDGQHRFHEARELKIGVWYSISPNKDITPADVNAEQGGWSISDYIHSYVAVGDEQYVALQDFMTKYRIPGTMSAMLLCDSTAGQSVVNRIKAGTFEVKTKEYADRIAQTIDGIRPLFPHVKTVCSVNSLMRFGWVKGFEPARMVRQCRKYPGALQPCATRDQYAAMYEDIYNRNAKSGRLSLKFLADEAARKRGKNETVSDESEE